MSDKIEKRNKKKGLFNYAEPLSNELCDAIQPTLYAFLTHLGVNSVLDIKKFVKEQGYEPCISSIFLFGLGGSYDYTSSNGTAIWIHNGTLQRVGTQYFSNISKQYIDLKLDLRE